jgi:Cu/Zn superoxide dismutase
MRTTKPLLSVLAIAAIGAGITACNPASVTSSSGTPPSTASVTDAGTTGVTTGPGRYILRAMPAGTVTISRGDHGVLLAHVVVAGLTPGSAHSVSFVTGSGRTVPFTMLTADSTGQAAATLTSQGRVDAVRGGRLVISLGDTVAYSAMTSMTNGRQLAAEPIAEASFPSGAGETVTLRPVSPYGRPAGVTTITFDPSAQTLTITVTATGLTPGPHAAHVHLGSCQSQGAVKYMIPDFIADSNGAIVDQTRVVTGVTSYPGPGNWYLNLHMGGMNQILANGEPTLYFRPMLCTDITSVAVAGSASPSASASATASSTPAMPPSSVSPAPSSSMPSSSMATSPSTTSPSASASPSTTPTVTATPSPSGSTDPTPTVYPTHW